MKKVLLVTYYWPPAGGPGVQRMVRFARLLPEFGWEPVILTVKNGDYPARDEELIRELPADIKVYRTSAIEPYGLFRFLSGKGKSEKIPTYVLNRGKKEGFVQKTARFLRANLFVPDARIGWIPFLLRSGRKIIRQEKPDLILSSSPPHSLQLALRSLVEKSGLPWVCDMRDPWSDAFWEKELRRLSLTDRLNRRLERKVLSCVSCVTTVSAGLGETFVKKGAPAYEVIHNGYEDIGGTPVPSEKFRIYYFGHLAKSQNPAPFLTLLNSLDSRQKNQIQLTFIGSVFGEYRERFQSLEEIHCDFLDYMPKASMLELARDASLFLKIQAESGYADKSVGTKIYDYLSLRAPIMVIGGSGGVLQDMMTDTGRGRVFDIEDQTGMKSYLLHQLQNRTLPAPTKAESENKYHVRYNVRKLAELMDSMTDGKAS